MAKFEIQDDLNPAEMGFEAHDEYNAETDNKIQKWYITHHDSFIHLMTIQRFSTSRFRYTPTVRIEYDSPNGIMQVLYPADQIGYMEVENQEELVRVLADLEFPAAIAKLRQEKIAKII